MIPILQKEEHMPDVLSEMVLTDDERKLIEQRREAQHKRAARAACELWMGRIADAIRSQLGSQLRGGEVTICDADGGDKVRAPSVVARRRIDLMRRSSCSYRAESLARSGWTPRRITEDF